MDHDMHVPPTNDDALAVLANLVADAAMTTPDDSAALHLLRQRATTTFAALRRLGVAPAHLRLEARDNEATVLRAIAAAARHARAHQVRVASSGGRTVPEDLVERRRFDQDASSSRDQRDGECGAAGFTEAHVEFEQWIEAQSAQDVGRARLGRAV